MNRAPRRQRGKGALELIEEAAHQLRAAPPATLAIYGLGTVPFVLGLLYFGADMSRSPFASRHLTQAALGMAVLFVWMKFWQGVFVQAARARLTATPRPRWSFRRGLRLGVVQAILQPIELVPIGFLLVVLYYAPPVGVLLILPVVWSLTFFQNVAVVADGSPSDLKTIIRHAGRLAALGPLQNVYIVIFMGAFGFFVFLNWSLVCWLLPHLAKMLLGVESVFTRSGLSALNTTYFAVMFSLTYLCVDPLMKEIYVLRCFYGESLRSGEDLKAEVKRFAAAQPVVAALLVLVALAHSAPAAAGILPHLSSVAQTDSLLCRRLAVGDALGSSGACGLPIRNTADYQSALQRDGGHAKKALRPAAEPGILPGGTASAFPQIVRISREPLRIGMSSPGGRMSLSMAAAMTTAATADPPSPPAAGVTPASAPGVSPPELDRAINRVIHERKYTWRMPHEKSVQDDAGNGVIARFLEKAGSLIRRWLRAMGGWLDRLFRRLFPDRWVTSSSSGSGYGWILSLEILLYGLVIAAVIALLVLAYRIWRGRRQQTVAVAGEPIQPAPDVSDENVGADQLPEDGWIQLAGELLDRGELRLAMRALYLASLSHLADRNLINVARFKSNREYERELRRRAHSFPEMLSVFGDNLNLFERIWYGTHEVNAGLVDRFAANVRIIQAAG